MQYEQTVRSTQNVFPGSFAMAYIRDLLSEKQYVEPFLSWLGLGKAILLWAISLAMSCVFPSASYIMLRFRRLEIVCMFFQYTIERNFGSV